MKKLYILFATMFAVVVLAVGAGVASAEPHKNQIILPASCDNGRNYTLVLNGEGNAGHVLGSNNNVIPVKYTVTYLNAENQEPIATYRYDNGKKTGLEGKLVSCSGTTEFEDWKMGRVVSIFEFEALVTPNSR